MKLQSARAAWHWAFDPNVGGINIADMINEWGVEFSAKGADNRICDHVEKGLIQHAVNILKHRDPPAWAFGMIAYAPIGYANAFERSTLLNYMRERFHEATGNVWRYTPQEVPILMLGRIAYQDIAHEDVTGQRRRRKYCDFAQLLGISSAEEYEKEWHRHYVYFRELCKTLPERALPPIATVVWRVLDLEEGGVAAASDLRNCLGVR